MTTSQKGAIIVIVCGTVLLSCAACVYLASDYLNNYLFYYFNWLNKFSP